MRLRAWAWLALSSLPASAAAGATRPRYGGALAIELSTPWTSLDPADLHSAISTGVAETLVRINERGEAEPLLATAWRTNGRRWTFTLRPKVVFHDGEPLTAATAAPALLAALKKTHADVTVQAGGQTLVVTSDQVIPDLMLELAAPRAAIYRKSDANPLIGTGPFRVAAWEPGKRLSLAAFDDYWGGRPYLDSVNISFGYGRVRADVFDIPPGPNRRILPEGTETWSSAPQRLVALVGAGAPAPLMQALALAIDRAPIVNVLAQRRGEPAFALLPQWLSGYAFLFQTPPDIARAKQLVAQLRPGPLMLSYPADDPFLRSVAERIALNARDAGATVQPLGTPNGNLSLAEWPLESNDAPAELSRMAALMGLSDRAAALEASKPDSLYQAERELLDGHRVIPIIYLPDTYAIAPRVHLAVKNGRLRLPLEDLWVEP